MAERKASVVQTEAEPMSIAKPDGFDLNKFKTKRAGNARVHRPTLLRVLAALTGAHGVMPV